MKGKRSSNKNEYMKIQPLQQYYYISPDVFLDELIVD